MKFTRLLCVAALAATALAARAADESTTTFTFSDPSKPGRLRAVISNGDLLIRGADVDVVTIRTSAEKDKKDEEREDGLRVIATSAQYTAVEQDNVLTIEYGQMGGAGAEFEIVVPRSTTVQLQSNFGGDVRIEEVQGDVEIKNMNGKIVLRGLGGGALVETMNGEINASFVALPADRPLAFSSMNGGVALHLPVDASANVRFRTQNGSILTDFAPDALVTKSEPTGAAYAPVAADVARAAADAAREAVEVARTVAEEVRVAVRNETRTIKGADPARAAPQAPRPPRVPRPPSIPALAGGKVVSGTLNGGGTDIQIVTMNGDIVVRKLKDE